MFVFMCVHLVVSLLLRFILSICLHLLPVDNHQSTGENSWINRREQLDKQARTAGQTGENSWINR